MELSAALNTFRSYIAQFVEFNEAEWTAFAGHLKLYTVKKKLYFAVPGKVCNQVGYIVSGSVRYFHVKDGQEITGYFSFENELVSSYKSYLLNTPSFNYIQALEDTQIITFSREDMRQMLSDPILAFKMERFGRLIAEHYLCCYEDRVSSFITQSPEERYMQLLSTGKEILQRMPQYYIANYLGITAVSLSRIRRRIMSIAS